MQSFFLELLFLQSIVSFELLQSFLVLHAQLVLTVVTLLLNFSFTSLDVCKWVNWSLGCIGNLATGESLVYAWHLIERVNVRVRSSMMERWSGRKFSSNVRWVGYMMTHWNLFVILHDWMSQWNVIMSRSRRNEFRKDHSKLD